MDKLKTNQILIYCLLMLALLACNVPKLTVADGNNLKNTIPKNYQDTSVVDENSAKTPWRAFFTDPKLISLIETAIKNNHELLITLQNIDIARSNLVYRKGLLAPSVTTELGIETKKVGRYTSEGAGNASTEMSPGKKIAEPLMNYAPGFSASWEVDIWKKLSLAKQSAVQHYLATIEGKNFVISNLVAEVAGNYYELTALDNQLDILYEFTNLQRKMLEIAKLQKESGVNTELAVKNFEAELLKNQAAELTIKQQITERENALNLLLGQYPQTIERSKTEFLHVLPQIVNTGVPADLLSNRPDITRAELELKAAKLDAEAARKEFYPSLNISASLGLEAFNPNYITRLPESLAYSLLGGLTAPLINISAIKSRFINANAQQIQALYDYYKTILSSYIEVNNLMSNNKNIEQYFNLKTAEVSKLEQSNEIVNQLFQNSRADYLEVLMTQREMLSAKTELVDAKKQQLVNSVNLYVSLGGGWR